MQLFRNFLNFNLVFLDVVLGIRTQAHRIVATDGSCAMTAAPFLVCYYLHNFFIPPSLSNFSCSCLSLSLSFSVFLSLSLSFVLLILQGFDVARLTMCQGSRHLLKSWPDNFPSFPIDNLIWNLFINRSIKILIFYSKIHENFFVGHQMYLNVTFRASKNWVKCYF